MLNVYHYKPEKYNKFTLFFANLIRSNKLSFCPTKNTTCVPILIYQVYLKKSCHVNHNFWIINFPNMLLGQSISENIILALFKNHRTDYSCQYNAAVIISSRQRRKGRRRGTFKKWLYNWTWSRPSKLWVTDIENQFPLPPWNIITRPLLQPTLTITASF